ncbi:hypothetical protein [Deinococcus hopiensis]|uniref:Uncharacterized protein n=1 Tax=Deinococcus hopiensis KR-140 TaxID=695939 RepID=A0A1W1UB93_9DEIO|nr:hypothetical protein [Deinococcus hopiensis]SMB78071.1 hypothetical protein SAMN00790413_06478 [Deinococcus hopiensis KR-140]
MSNIHTSYFEIVRLDGRHVTPEEQDWLFQGLVRYRESFGSYWVRIYREYDSETRRMRIQYGSGKHGNAIDKFIDDSHFQQNYAVWIRTADEGSDSDNLLFSSGLTIEGVPFEEWERARYGFDSLVLAGTPKHFRNRTKPIGEQAYRRLLPLGGSYTTLTDRGMVDIKSSTIKPSDYDPNYQPRRFLTHFEGPIYLEWEEASPDLPNGWEELFSLEPEIKFAVWCWKGRAVNVCFAQEISYPYSSWPRKDLPLLTFHQGLVADGWTNLVNSSYLTFRNWHVRQVFLEEQS